MKGVDARAGWWPRAEVRGTSQITSTAAYDERWYDLLVILSDANSETSESQLVEEEATALAGLKEMVEQKRVLRLV